MTENITFKIWEVNLGTFEKELERLNRKASALDQPPITFEIVNEEYVKFRSQGHRYDGSTLKQFEIAIEGSAPRIEGWRFMAVIDHEPKGNILRSAPDTEEVPQSYRTADADCDHCQHQRVRVSTFLLLSDDGEWKQVGRQCLRDFLGHKTPEKLAGAGRILS